MDNIQIIYEDNHLIAVNKPAGWLVQGDETGDLPISEWVKKYIKLRYKKPGAVFLGLVHRLDRPVSGALVFARTSKALTRMNKLFQDREVQKTYLAVTRVRPKPIVGHLTHYILKDRSRNVAKAYDKIGNRTKDAKKSELDYEMISEIDGHHLVKVNPLTGRPHQIRVQLSSIGCPIKGDLKYGFSQPNQDGSICLHCLKMEFIHPVKKELISIEARVPDHYTWHPFQDFEL